MINLKRLKDIREDNDISQKEIADILNVTRSTYSLWELGINIIPLKNLCDFSDYFNISLDYILGLTNKKESKNLVKGFNLINLGNNIRKIRVKNNLSQENISDIIGVTQACIARYEKGDICISISNLYKFCKKFHISLTEICDKTINKDLLS